MFKITKFLLPIICIFIFTFSGCTLNTSQGSGKIEVVTTYYPLYTITKNLIKDVENINLSVLADNSAICIHDYNFTPEDFKKIESANLFVITGFEESLDDIIRSKEKQNNFMLCDSSMNVNKIDGNQYIWLNPHNVIIQAKNISDSLIAIDPSNKDIYLANFENFSSKVAENISLLKEKLKPLSNVNFLVFHEGFEYFSEAFNLKLKTYEPEHENGLVPNQISEILEYIRSNNVVALFDEATEQSKLIPMIQQEIQIKNFTLDAVTHGDKENNDEYLNIINQNAAIILAASQQ